MNTVAIPQQGPQSAIAARGIRKEYGSRAVLDDLQFTVEAGHTVGLLGANGAGKTTLLKILLGLIAPDGGESWLAGESSRSLSPRLRERIGYVPQRPDQFAWFNGKALLAYVGAFYPKYDRDYAAELVERWKVSLRTPIAALSPGQQQRLSIVRALAARPELLFLDEPIASLDPAARISVIDELLAERARRPLTIVFSSHIVGDLRRLCTHFTVLARGRIALYQSAAALRSLVRVTIQGDESVLAAFEPPGAVHIRRPREGERTVVTASDAVGVLSAALPPGVRAGEEVRDEETVLTEWMQ